MHLDISRSVVLIDSLCITELTNKTAPFPICCPKFKCEDGAKLEYPEIPTVAPVPEEKGSTPKA